MSRPRRLFAPLALALVLAVTGHAVAQGHGGGGPGGGGPGGGGPGRGGIGGGGMNGGMGGGLARGPFGAGANGSYSVPPPGSRPNGTTSSDNPMGSGMQLAPPGRWWDNGKFAQSLGLDSRQQHRMDDIFGENKGTLVLLYKNLQHEQSQLSKAVRARELDEPTIFQQIDRVAQARAELEKANAHMLLQIRKEMTPDQAARLDDHRPEQ